MMTFVRNYVYLWSNLIEITKVIELGFKNDIIIILYSNSITFVINIVLVRLYKGIIDIRDSIQDHFL